MAISYDWLTEVPKILYINFQTHSHAANVYIPAHILLTVFLCASTKGLGWLTRGLIK